MSTRNSVSPIVTVLIVFFFLASASAVFADPVYIYTAGFDLRIPDNLDDTKGWMQDAIINIPDHLTIYDLDVGISLEHTSAFDLEIYIQSPQGTALCLNKYAIDEFFTGADYTETIFDDEADVPIEDGNAPFTGRFRPKALDPQNLLEIFDGQDAFGTWRLRIYDAHFNDTGGLQEVELTITVPEPASAILFSLAAALIHLKKPRKTQN